MVVVIRKVTDYTAKMHPKHVHLVCQGTLSFTIVASFIAHALSPSAEALGLFISALFAGWQRDIETRMIRELRRVRHDFDEA